MQDRRFSCAYHVQNLCLWPFDVVLQVVQVYTYMVNPLGVGGQDGGTAAAPGAAPAVQQPPQSDTAKAAPPGRQPPSSNVSRVTGWEVRLVMEYCNAVSDVPPLRRAVFVCCSDSLAVVI